MVDFFKLSNDEGGKLLKILMESANAARQMHKQELVRVGTLRPEEITKKAGLLSECDHMVLELEELQAKIKALYARREVILTEWWGSIKRNHNLPSGYDYEISDEGFIMKRVERKPEPPPMPPEAA